MTFAFKRCAKFTLILLCIIFITVSICFITYDIFQVSTKTSSTENPESVYPPIIRLVSGLGFLISMVLEGLELSVWDWVKTWNIWQDVDFNEDWIIFGCTKSFCKRAYSSLKMFIVTLSLCHIGFQLNPHRANVLLCMALGLICIPPIFDLKDEHFQGGMVFVASVVRFCISNEKPNYYYIIGYSAIIPLFKFLLDPRCWNCFIVDPSDLTAPLLTTDSAAGDVDDVLQHTKTETEKRNEDEAT